MVKDRGTVFRSVPVTAAELTKLETIADRCARSFPALSRALVFRAGLRLGIAVLSRRPDLALKAGAPPDPSKGEEWCRVGMMAEELDGLEEVAARCASLSRTKLIRAALRIGFEALEKKPETVVEGLAPMGVARAKRTA